MSRIAAARSAPRSQRARRAGRWRPLVTGVERRRVLNIVAQTARALTSRTSAAPSGDLSDGDPGIALLFAYLARVPEARFADAGDWAREFLARGLSRPAITTFPALFGGWLGSAWAAQHLEAQLCGGSKDLCAEVVPVVESLIASPDERHFDLVYGLAGAGVFLAERGDRESIALLDALIRRLRARASAEAPGLSWWTAPRDVAPAARARHPVGHYDVGVAHGVPGVCAVLAIAAAHGVELARQICRSAIDWLLAQEEPAPSASGFTSCFVPGEARHPSRLAWCYGDPGVAGALATCAAALDADDLRMAAHRIGRRAALRDVATSGVVDASLCHGAAGLSLIFQRLWQATGDELFADTARRWMWDTVARLADGGGLMEAGFLTGRAGAALALLAAASEIEPAWDAALLLSVPAPRRRSARR
jgi:lantibiotic modifying enzyme